MNKVFLGGTCCETTWRDKLIPMLNIDYFNPVVSDWTTECQAEEQRQKDELCNIHLYVITPRMKGVFSIAEIIESSHDERVKTVVYIQPTDVDENGEVIQFDNSQMRSLNAVCGLAMKHGAIICNDLYDVAVKLNKLNFNDVSI